MNNQPTPETDNISRGNHVVPTEWAQQLERERDEAREDLEHWKSEWEIVEARLCGWKHPRDNGIIFEHEVIPVLRKERDAARERHATEATEHMLAINKLCNERDEAREELHDIRLNLGEDADDFTLLHAVCALQNERDSLQIALEEISNLAKTLKTERDEAREEAHRFRSLHYSHLGINGSASWFPWEGK